MKDLDCVAFLQWALPRLGLEWRGFRKVRRQVCRRVAARVRSIGLADTAAYRERLASDRAEWPTLARLCTIPISRFYRDREVFDDLGSAVIPALADAARRRGGGELECWSAGCASGEEPYTLALQWRMTLASRFPELGLRVLGTDVDATLLERARAACYRSSSLETLPAGWREAAFEARGKLFCLRERRFAPASSSSGRTSSPSCRSNRSTWCSAATWPLPISATSAPASRSSAWRAGCASAARSSSGCTSGCRLRAPPLSPGPAAAPCSGYARRFDSPQGVAFTPAARFAPGGLPCVHRIHCANEGARAFPGLSGTP